MFLADKFLNVEPFYSFFCCFWYYVLFQFVNFLNCVRITFSNDRYNIALVVKLLQESPIIWVESWTSKEENTAVNPLISNLSLLFLVNWAFSHDNFSIFSCIFNSILDFFLDQPTIVVDCWMGIARCIYNIEVEAQIWRHCCWFYLRYCLSMLYDKLIMIFLFVLFKKAFHKRCFTCASRAN